MQIAPSCSLLHVPIDLALETGLDPEVKSWLAFSVQKLEELAALGTALAGGRGNAGTMPEGLGRGGRRPQGLAPHSRRQGGGARRRHRRRDAPPRQRLRRSAPAFSTQRFNLPAFPTTTIGSFPQTADVRNARAAHARGALTDAAYKPYLQNQTARAVRWQEEIGLDVLVHGEFERNDMVQYFGEQLDRLRLHRQRLGADPTARAASGRRSCSATSRARSR